MKLGRVRMSNYEGSRWTTIVLTTAHLDHRPENCARANLKALCQRCHLRYDAAHHAETRQITRRTAGGQLQLLEA
jgi:5-methylcytosine-specific restriction endonuclease McrA